MFREKHPMMMAPIKACPVVVRQGDGIEILVFKHPLAGIQLVKGTIEAGESPREAAVRELMEEAGLAGASVVSDLGLWKVELRDQVWSFHLCDVGHALPDEWVHYCADEGGHDFSFFWHPLDRPPSEEWHEVFQGALAFVRKVVLAGTSNP